MRRAGLWTMLIVGVALVVMPFATGMFGKASAGERMMKDFEPIMTAGSVRTTSQYYGLFKGIGTDFGPVMSADKVARFQRYLKEIDGVPADMSKLIPAIAEMTGHSTEEIQNMLANDYTSLSLMMGLLAQMRLDMSAMVGLMAKDSPGFAQVDPALAHFSVLVGVMQRNVDNFAKANSLPKMGLLPWFFVVPGVVIALISALMLITFGTASVTKAALPRETHLRAA